MYIEVPIIGSGDRTVDPYRANVPVPKSAVIPTDKSGRPQFTTTIIWVDDKLDTEVDRSIRRIPIKDARRLIQQLDPKINPDTVEQKTRANIQPTR